MVLLHYQPHQSRGRRPLTQLSPSNVPNFIPPLIPSVTDMWVSGLDPSNSVQFRNHLRTATQTVNKGVSLDCTSASMGQWQKWINSCTELGLDSFLEVFTEKVLIMLVFIYQVCIEELATQGNQIRLLLVEDNLFSITRDRKSVV